MSTVLFLSPFRYTTKGHMNIASKLADGLTRRQIPMVTVGGREIKSGLISRLVERSDNIFVIMDFPDTGMINHIHRVRRLLPPSTRWGYLQMSQRKVDAPRFDYHFRFDVEPLALESHNAGGPKTKVYLTRPIATVDNNHLRAGADDDITRRTFDLVIPTGDAGERQYLRAVASERARAADVRLIDPTRMGPQKWHRYAAAARRIYAAGGYSTVWELHALGVLEKTDFIFLERPTELCEERVRVARGTTRHSLLSRLDLFDCIADAIASP